MKPPIGGPTINPNKPANCNGAIVRARLRGVDISVKYRPQPAMVMALPKPQTVLAAHKLKNACESEGAKASPSIPIAPSMGPTINIGLLPNSSAAKAAGTLLTIRASAEDAVTIPSSEVDKPAALARKGRTGTITPCPVKLINMVPEIGYTREDTGVAACSTASRNSSQHIFLSLFRSMLLIISSALTFNSAQFFLSMLLLL
mmetsp:Transcript_22190/g.53766  ORF Transcript_22190/g.53766 Transcript_22190/m.53766 type:complete len:202 (+) Transcript_22190:1096-1701(+)